MARLGGWMFFIPLLVVAISATLIADGWSVWGVSGLAAAAVVAWLGGIWTLPFSEDAYVRAVRRIMHETLVDVQGDTRSYNDRLTAMRQAIIRSLPAQDKSIGELLRREVSPADADFETDSRLTYERAVWAAEIIRALKTLTRRYENGDEGISPTSLLHEISLYLETARKGQRMSLASLVERTERLLRLSPPYCWQTRHDEYVAALSAYVAALCDYYSLIDENADDECTSLAAAAMVEHYRTFSTLTKRYSHELSQSFRGRPER